MVRLIVSLVDGVGSPLKLIEVSYVRSPQAGGSASEGLPNERTDLEQPDGVREASNNDLRHRGTRDRGRWDGGPMFA